MKSLYSLLLYFYIPAVLLHNVFLHIGFYDTITLYGGKHMTFWEPITFIKELILSCCFVVRDVVKKYELNKPVLYSTMADNPFY